MINIEDNIYAYVYYLKNCSQYTKKRWTFVPRTHDYNSPTNLTEPEPMKVRWFTLFKHEKYCLDSKFYD